MNFLSAVKNEDEKYKRQKSMSKLKNSLLLFLIYIMTLSLDMKKYEKHRNVLVFFL